MSEARKEERGARIRKIKGILPSLLTPRFAIVLALLLLSCEREERRFREPPPTSGSTHTVPQSDLQPGGRTKVKGLENPYEENAWAASEGKRLYLQFNCAGCHAQGGGGIGPALMDDKWIYGSESAQIFNTILDGRPNGMPSFRGRIPEPMIWQIVAYVRSMSGQLDKDVSPTRDDDMSGKPTESQTPKEPTINTAPPPEGTR